MGGRALIVLDTHVLLWLDSGNARLGRRARSAIDRALQAHELAVSAISFWEVTLLQQRGRVKLAQPLAAWRAGLLDVGLHELAVNGDAAILAASLRDFHGDPADRILVASCSTVGATFYTADERILTWGGSLARRDAER